MDGTSAWELSKAPQICTERDPSKHPGRGHESVPTTGETAYRAARSPSRLGRSSAAHSTGTVAYARMYGVRRTTVHLPDDLKAALERTAAGQGRTEAELIREGVRLVTERHATPEPRLPLFESGDGALADAVDKALAE